VIFLTIGSHEPFDRLVRAVDEWAARYPGWVFGQITDAGDYRPRNMEWVGHMGSQDYADRVAASGLLIAHAGMGSIITALSAGKPIVIMPRRGHLQETRNDHQWATAERLRGRPGIHVAADEAALPKVLEQVLHSPTDSLGTLSPHASPALLEAVAGFVRAQAAR
jgi:UDP-N-acetylglucosamine transferase subunit ALG13